MSTRDQGERTTGTSRSREWLGRAWLAVAVIPVFFIPALAVAYALYDVMGYQPENDNAPFWVDLVCSIPAIAVFLAPCAAAVLYGRRATRDGDRRGLVPLVIGALVGLGFTVLSLVSLVAGSLD
ncbi:MAG: hypothetical protein ACXV4A_14905 [Actinomycetes bacterium]